MKKYLYLLLVAIFSSLCVCLTSCGGDDDDEPDAPNNVGTTSELVGKWEVVKTTTTHYTFIPEMKEYYDNVEVEDGNGVYWEFTKNKVTTYDPTDLLNGKPQNYTYNKETRDVTIFNFISFTVTKLTSREMILTFESSDEYYGVSSVMEFRKK